MLADALDQNLAIGVRAAVADHLGRAPTRAELTAARRAAHRFAALGRAQVLHVQGADDDDNAGDRTYCARQARCDHEQHSAPRTGGCWQRQYRSQSTHNHAQIARNLRAVSGECRGARLIQAEGLDSESAADVAATLADALEELQRLERRLNRRIRRDQTGLDTRST